MRNYLAGLFTVVLALCVLGPAEAVYTGFDPPGVKSPEPESKKPKFAEGRILVKPKAGLRASALANFNARRGAKVLRRFPAIGDLQVIELPKGEKVLDAVARYKRSGLVEYAEPDYILEILATHPNDPKYQDGTLWGMHNTGQDGGTSNADIDAPEGWDTRTDAYLDTADRYVVVAVIDTGVRYTHDDLEDNMWINDDETPGNEIDDDENGYVDDVKGYDFANDDNDPWDDYGHGTHCAGIVGAVGDNYTGVVGVAWDVQIMPVKFLGSGGGGWTSDAVASIEYAVDNGADILSNSWGGDEFSSSLADAVRYAQDADVIFVAAAGNNGSDNDQYPFYPTSYGHDPATADIDNIVSVAATDRDDFLAGFSCYGSESVDLGAPGVEIYSTFNSSDSSYKSWGGTSMACPHAAGALALLMAEHDEDTYQELIARLLQSTDSLPVLEGKCVSQGRLNLDEGLTGTVVDLFAYPDYDAVFGGIAGGPFIPSSRIYVIRNQGDSSLSWTASKTQNWLSISSAGGTLDPGESVELEVWINSNADSLVANTYNDAITITNTTDGSGNTTRGVELRVSPGPIYVSTSGDDNDDGSTWALAKATVQAGVDAADFGQPVWVAQGVYEERIELVNSVSVYGGFSGSGSVWDPSVYTTVLDGSAGGRVVTADATITRITQVGGFTIRNGKGVKIGIPSYGGGIFLDRASATITNNVIVGNTGCETPCRSYGGGLCCMYGGCLVTNNTFKANSASYGAGLALLGGEHTITGNTIVGNRGSAVYMYGQSTFANNIVAFNRYGIRGSELVTFRNNCVYGNVYYDYSLSDSDTGYMLPPPTGSNGNISEDPLLADTTYGNLHIQPGSPCKNAGSNSDAVGSYDIDNQSRIQSGTVDIGSDESDNSTWSAGPYEIVRVDPTTGDDDDDGSTWGLAKQTLQAAMEQCMLSGGEVWAKAGTYNERIYLQPYAYLYGGFAGTESVRSGRPAFPRPDQDQYESTINGQQGGSVVEAAVAGVQASTVDGFTITGGSNSTASGGGVLVYHCDLVLRNNKIELNTAQNGGGIYCYSSESLIIANTISENDCDYYGGGVWLDNCQGTQVLHNEFSDNEASFWGGGIADCSTESVIANNIIVDNEADYGGGVWLDIGNPLLANNVIADNTCSEEGGGLSCLDCFGTVANNIIAFNSSGVYTYVSTEYPTFRNNDVYGNTAYNYSGSGLPDPSDIQADPLFVNRQNGDYHIQSSSPCRNAGDDDYAVGPFDMDWQPRIQATVDIGADEYSQVLMVSPDGSDQNDGRTWATAKLTVEDAIDDASSGEEIWVAEGTYEENIELTEGVSLYGGFVGDEDSRDGRDPRANETILDGGGSGSVVTANSGVTTATVIDGFTITNGTAAYSGGGVRCYMGAPTVTNNVIEDNDCTYNGGGVYILTASPVITDNIITSNSANNGGGVYDEGDYPVIARNLIIGNTATTFGGGISCCIDIMPTISDNIIVENEASYGGGIDCRGDSWAVISGNTICDNTASTQGGGISIYAGSYPTISNNIVAFNNSGIYSNSSSPTVDYNDVYSNTSYNYSGLSAGANDISSDPLFVNRSNDDYHLTASSPCREAGSNSLVVSSYDFDGQTRIQDTVEIGADEYPEFLLVLPTGSDSNTGRSWNGAKLTVQSAINAAAAGEEVWVAAGTYEENITLVDEVSIYGGFDGTELARAERDPDTNETILDGCYEGSVITSPSGVTSDTVVDGFTITHGYATNGAGIKCQSSSPTISNNRIQSNIGVNGGGIHWGSGSSPSITGNMMTSNYATGHGGGIYVNGAGGTVDGNEITWNWGHWGGGIWLEGGWTQITANTITGNTATIDHGGGIGWFDFNPYVANNTITANRAPNGAGVWCGGYSWATIVNNTFVTNGALSSNPGVGSDIHIEYSTPTVRNNIVVFGGAGIYAKNSSVTIDHNDVYDNGDFDYSGLQPGQYDISANPLLTGDLHLGSGSPCIDTGTSNSAPDYDKDGVSRPQDGDGDEEAEYDMGAYEVPEP